MIVGIGTTNEAKVLALKETLQLLPRFSSAEVKPISSQSGVSEQPLSLQETIQGAKNRAEGSFLNHQYSFGIESGLMEAPTVASGFLHISACCIYDGKRYYTGLSTGFELPPEILRLLLEEKMNLTQACLHLGISQNEQLGTQEGLIGILTHGKVCRKEYSKQCITAAILQLENASLYKGD